VAVAQNTTATGMNGWASQAAGASGLQRVGQIDQAPRYRLKFSGSTIQDENGNTYVPKGWNWGRWGFSQSQDAFNHALYKATIVRVVLRWWGLYANAGNDSYLQGAPGGVNPVNLAALDEQISWIIAQGMWVNLAIDSNCGQNGNQDAPTIAYCSWNGVGTGQNFWLNSAARDAFKALWQFIANRYKNVSRIAWYEVLPEPAPPTFTDADIKTFYSEMITTIRAVDADTPILIGGSGYLPNKASTVYDATFAKTVYTADYLNPAMTGGTMATKLGQLTSVRDTNNVPVFAQQAGDITSSDVDYSLLNAGLGLLVTNNVGYTYWEYRGSTNATNYEPLYQVGAGWAVDQGKLDAINSHF